MKNIPEKLHDKHKKAEVFTPRLYFYNIRFLHTNSTRRWYL